MTVATTHLHGVCPVLATPFDASGAPDEAGLARVVDFALHSGVDAVVFPGVASEVEQLSAPERERLVSLVAQRVAGRVPLVVGAAAAMVMAPARLAGDATALLAHYRELGAAGPVPIMLQNAPAPAHSAT
jgi:4-hydroxy-tetrahydrodipicolinate synthase